jgi:hypothetical protein
MIIDYRSSTSAQRPSLTDPVANLTIICPRSRLWRSTCGRCCQCHCQWLLSVEWLCWIGWLVDVRRAVCNGFGVWWSPLICWISQQVQQSIKWIQWTLTAVEQTHWLYDRITAAFVSFVLLTIESSQRWALELSPVDCSWRIAVTDIHV